MDFEFRLLCLFVDDSVYRLSACLPIRLRSQATVCRCDPLTHPIVMLEELARMSDPRLGIVEDTVSCEFGSCCLLSSHRSLVDVLSLTLSEKCNE